MKEELAMAVAYHGEIILGVHPRGNFATLPTAELKASMS